MTFRAPRSDDAQHSLGLTGSRVGREPGRGSDDRTPRARPTSGALTELMARATAAMFERLGARLNDPSLSEEQLHALVRSELTRWSRRRRSR